MPEFPMSQRPQISSFLGFAARSAAIVAVVILSSACGGQETAADAESANASANLVRTTTSNFNLIQVDAQNAPPLLTCTTSAQTIVLNAGALAISGTSFVATFTGTQSRGGVTSTMIYQEKGSVRTSGTSYTFTSAQTGSHTGTLTNGLLSISGYSYCGAKHSMVYQQQ
jgi:hypothetical protein